MKTNILATAVALPDQDLLARLHSLARTERESMAELVAHLTALELRPSLYAAQGYGSLFDYSTRELGLSEDAACSRISVVRASMRFPVILDHLLSGALTLTAVRLLTPHLTAENHEVVLARAGNQRREDLGALIAELAPRPDVPASVRKLPVRAPACQARVDAGSDPVAPTPMAPEPGDPAKTAPTASPQTLDFDQNAGQERSQVPPVLHSPRRPIVEPLAPDRYRVQFTIGQKAQDDLRAVQALLRREIPSGDPGAIFERALALLRTHVEKTKLGVVSKPRGTANTRPRRGTYENRIRLRTDNVHRPDSSPPEDRPPSRHIPNAVKRAVWYRDRGQCGFVSASGRRCAERNFLELHHIHPYALDGPATVSNISLRCRRHNQYEAEVVSLIWWKSAEGVIIRCSCRQERLRPLAGGLRRMTPCRTIAGLG